MSIKNYKLLDMLNKKGISKGSLQEMAGISSATLAKLSANEKVSLEVIEKICIALKVQPGDIMEIVLNEKAGE
jgi:DNA-binding Xre family transcriptional regulator